MNFEAFKFFIAFTFMYVLAFEDLYVNGQDAKDMLEQGKQQYHVILLDYL